MINNPQVFIKSTAPSVVELLISQWKKPENSHFDSIRNEAEDQSGLNNLTIPS